MEAQLASVQTELDKSQKRWSRGQEEWLVEVGVSVCLCVRRWFDFCGLGEVRRGSAGGLA